MDFRKLSSTYLASYSKQTVFLLYALITGYGVALLLTLFGGHTDSKLLQSIAPTDEEPPSKRLCRD